MPDVDECYAQIPPSARVVSKLDCKHSYFQIELAPESRPLTCFITPVGRYVYNRLPMGLSSFAEVLQKRLSELIMGSNLRRLAGRGKIVVMMDDIIIFADTVEEHDKILQVSLLSTPASVNYECLNVCFLAARLPQKADKVAAVRDMQAPTEGDDSTQLCGVSVLSFEIRAQPIGWHR